MSRNGTYHLKQIRSACGCQPKSCACYSSRRESEELWPDYCRSSAATNGPRLCGSNTNYWSVSATPEPLIPRAQAEHKFWNSCRRTTWSRFATTDSALDYDLVCLQSEWIALEMSATYGQCCRSELFGALTSVSQIFELWICFLYLKHDFRRYYDIRGEQ